jgi:hypothetical protein
MVRFLEREGYDLTYATDIDVHAASSLLLSHKGFLSVGHDEYWSWQQRQNVEAARDAGVNLGFFSANTCYWEIRLDPSPITGQPYRTEVSYKWNAALDPLTQDPTRYYLITTQWRLPHGSLGGMPEDEMMGSLYDYEAAGDIVISDNSSWIYAGTGLAVGDHLPGLLGYEVDEERTATPPDTQLLNRTTTTFKGKPAISDITLYQGESGALVFAAGTIHWSFGLDSYGSSASLVNPAVQQITRNVLAAFIHPAAPLPFSVAVLSPSKLNFGNQVLGITSPTLWATLTNDQEGALDITSIGVGGDFHLGASTCGGSLPAHSRCTIPINAITTQLGLRTGTLSVTSDAANGTQTVQLTVKGVNRVGFDPSGLSFGSQMVGTASAAGKIYLGNYQSSSINPSLAISGDYQIVSTACGSSLAPNTLCLNTVLFKPTTVGVRSGTLTASVPGLSAISATLSGTGIAPVVMSPSSLSFGNQVVGRTSTTQSITITNNQGTSLSITGISMQGSAATDFIQTGNTCGSQLGPTSSCSIDLAFRPAATGTRSAALSVSDKPDPNSPYVIPLVGVGVLPLAVSPPNLPFGNEAIGNTSAAQSVRLTNNANVTVSITAVSIGGGAAGDFTRTGGTCKTQLGGASSCTITVVFDPTAAGPRNSTLTIDDSLDADTHLVPLSGVGLVPVTVLPDLLNFGQERLGKKSASQGVVITNNASTALSIARMSIRGSARNDFHETGHTCGAQLSAHSDCTITIVFKPLKKGTRTAVLKIQDHPDADGPQMVRLSGVGLGRQHLH